MFVGVGVLVAGGVLLILKLIVVEGVLVLV